MMGTQGEAAFKRTVLNCLADATKHVTLAAAITFLEGVKNSSIFKFVNESLQLLLTNTPGYVSSCKKGQMPVFNESGDATWIADVRAKLIYFCKFGNGDTAVYGQLAVDGHCHEIKTVKEQQSLSAISVVYPSVGV